MVWHFRYDGDTPIGLEFDGVEYYYVTNLQGDVIAILNDLGECVAEYEYDAWGNCTVTNDTDTIAYDNPLRYRGYYYDFDTKLYYLQSRFYDANTGRFINADEPTLIGANGGMVSNNLFAYCDNNPVNKADSNGNESYWSYWWRGFKIIFGIKKKADKFKTLAGIMTTCKNVSEVRLEHIKNIFNYGSGKYKQLSNKLKYKNKDKYIKYVKERYKVYVENYVRYLDYPVKYKDIKDKAWGKISKNNRNKIIKDAYVVDPNFFNRSGVVAATKATIDSIGLVYGK